MPKAPTPGTVQDVMLQMLSDGYRHHSTELHSACSPTSNITTVNFHICKLREYVKTKGLNILCVFYNRNFYYQLVRTLHNDE